MCRECTSLDQLKPPKCYFLEAGGINAIYLYNSNLYEKRVDKEISEAA